MPCSGPPQKVLAQSRCDSGESTRSEQSCDVHSLEHTHLPRSHAPWPAQVRAGGGTLPLGTTSDAIGHELFAQPGPVHPSLHTHTPAMQAPYGAEQPLGQISTAHERPDHRCSHTHAPPTHRPCAAPPHWSGHVLCSQ